MFLLSLTSAGFVLQSLFSQLFFSCFYLPASAVLEFSCPLQMLAVIFWSFAGVQSHTSSSCLNPSASLPSPSFHIFSPSKHFPPFKPVLLFLRRIFSCLSVWFRFLSHTRTHKPVALVAIAYHFFCFAAASSCNKNKLICRLLSPNTHILKLRPFCTFTSCHSNSSFTFLAFKPTRSAHICWTLAKTGRYPVVRTGATNLSSHWDCRR